MCGLFSTTPAASADKVMMSMRMSGRILRSSCIDGA
jgi:hypothetical protein